MDAPLSKSPSICLPPISTLANFRVSHVRGGVVTPTFLFSPKNKEYLICRESFRSPSYESLDKYNLALESFNLSDVPRGCIPYSLVTPNYCNDWYYVKNNTPPKSPTKPQSSITPQPQIKFRSTKKSPSMSSINMAPAFNKISAPNEITKHEHYKQPNNLKTKETTGNEYFTCPVNGNNFMYNQIGIVNEQQYTKDQT
uniref:Uncharacterized protein n=1 Tax=Megaselia scalaris TaxID=36166 RepID=T1GQ89_MEGSC